MKFILPPWAAHSFKCSPVIVHLSIQKIEHAWIDQGRFHGYVGVAGEGGKQNKYAQVVDWVKSHDEIYMPLLNLSIEDEKLFRFNDGRHTFSYFRDSGFDSMDFGVPSDMQHVFVEHYAYPLPAC
jgi:hypothetical protein